VYAELMATRAVISGRRTYDHICFDTSP
jgi:hypothetical protein